MYQGTHFALVPAQGYLDIRWTPLDRFEPENFQALNAKRTQMGTNGKAGFIRAGDVLWVLGDSESYRLQKVGFNLSIHRMLEGYEFVGKYCGVAVGNSIIAVTTTGVLQINGNTGQFTQISGLDRIILKRWANNLSPSGGEAKIYVTADSQLGAVFIWNRAVGECAVLWTTTNRITLLTDCWYRWAATVYLPNNREAGRRTLFVQEKQEYEYPTAQTGSAGGSALFHPTFGLPSSPTMMGVTQGGTSAKDVTNLVFQASAITTNAEGVTEITVPTSSTTTPAGRYVGAVLYPLTGSLAGTGYKVLRSSPASGGGVKLQLSADITSSLTTSDYLSLSPVVVGFVGWPLGSRSYGQDLLSRRVVDSMVTVLGAGKTGMAGGTNYGLFKYGLARYEDLADDTVLGAASTDPMTDPARPLPWTPTWEVEAGKDYTLDLSRPEGLYTAIQGDGGLVLPTFRCVVSGIWFTILAQFLFGRIEPNDALQST